MNGDRVENDAEFLKTCVKLKTPDSAERYKNRNSEARKQLFPPLEIGSPEYESDYDKQLSPPPDMNEYAHVEHEMTKELVPEDESVQVSEASAKQLFTVDVSESTTTIDETQELSIPAEPMELDVFEPNIDPQQQQQQGEEEKVCVRLALLKKRALSPDITLVTKKSCRDLIAATHGPEEESKKKKGKVVGKKRRRPKKISQRKKKAQKWPQLNIGNNNRGRKRKAEGDADGTPLTKRAVALHTSGNTKRPPTNNLTDKVGASRQMSVTSEVGSSTSPRSSGVIVPREFQDTTQMLKFLLDNYNEEVHMIDFLQELTENLEVREELLLLAQLRDENQRVRGNVDRLTKQRDQLLQEIEALDKMILQEL